MKRNLILVLLGLVSLTLMVMCITLVSVNKTGRANDNNASMLSTSSNTLQPFDVMEDFECNPFKFFGNQLLLCAGDSKKSNAMTIGWGAMGNIWGMQRPVVTVYVAPGRYTWEFMENYRYFTVMHFADMKVYDYMGRNSGRDGDKAAALGLHVAYTRNGTPYYEEADMVLECAIMYGGQFQPSLFRNDVPREMYANFPAGVHYQYVGDVVGAWKK